MTSFAKLHLNFTTFRYIFSSHSFIPTRSKRAHELWALFLSTVSIFMLGFSVAWPTTVSHLIFFHLCRIFPVGCCVGNEMDRWEIKTVSWRNMTEYREIKWNLVKYSYTKYIEISANWTIKWYSRVNWSCRLPDKMYHYEKLDYKRKVSLAVNWEVKHSESTAGWMRKQLNCSDWWVQRFEIGRRTVHIYRRPRYRIDGDIKYSLIPFRLVRLSLRVVKVPCRMTNLLHTMTGSRHMRSKVHQFDV